MMRTFARLLLILLALTVTAGPLFAAPVSLRSEPAIGLPTSTGSPLVDTLIALVASSGVVFGITIKRDIGSIAQKFVTRAQAAAGDYKTGIQNAGGKWEANAAAAESNWEQGTQAAISAKRFSKGVTGKGTKFQTNAVNLGSNRYGPGVANASDAYAKGMAPVLQVLSSLSLPPKSFRGSPQNQARSNAVGVALAALRSNR